MGDGLGNDYRIAPETLFQIEAAPFVSIGPEQSLLGYLWRNGNHLLSHLASSHPQYRSPGSLGTLAPWRDDCSSLSTDCADEPRAAHRFLKGQVEPSFARSNSLTCLGLALPWVFFITWPTKKPSILGCFPASAAR